MKVRLQPNIRVLLAVSITALQLSRESNMALPRATTICSSLLQLRITSLPIAVTEAGMAIDLMLVQPAKANLPIVVTELGKTSDGRLRQLVNAYSPIDVTDLGMRIDSSDVHSAKA